MPIVVIIFVIEECVWARGIAFIVQDAVSFSSHLFLAAWLVHYPVFGIRGCPHGNGLCWFEWCLRSPPETFRSLCSSHARGLGNYPAAGIWSARADGSLPYGGLILPYSVVALTSTQVLPTDGANCRVRFGSFFSIGVNEPKPNGPDTINLVEKMGSKTGL